MENSMLCLKDDHTTIHFLEYNKSYQELRSQFNRETIETNGVLPEVFKEVKVNDLDVLSLNTTIKIMEQEGRTYQAMIPGEDKSVLFVGNAFENTNDFMEKYMATVSSVIIEEIKTPEYPTNVCFGGKDFKTLFITERKNVYMIKMNVKGSRY